MEKVKVGECSQTALALLQCGKNTLPEVGVCLYQQLLFIMDPGTTSKTEWELSAMHCLPGLALTGLQEALF